MSFPDAPAPGQAAKGRRHLQILVAALFFAALFRLLREFGAYGP